MNENRISIIPLPILVSVNCQTAKAITNKAKINLIFLLNMGCFFFGSKGTKNNQKYFNVFHL